MLKSILVVHNYFGPRRVQFQPYIDDPLFLIKKQIEYLSRVKHSLNHVVFTVNSRGHDDLLTIEKARVCIPDKLQGATTELLVRENIGLSYGAFSDVYSKYRTNYDFYFFTEDDYLFTEDLFDSTMIEMLLENENPGYLCAAVRDIAGFGKHAGNSVGVITSHSLETVFLEKNQIPHINFSKPGDPYEHHDIPSQVLHSSSIHSKGFSLTDIGSRYTLYHVWPDGYEHFFAQNSKEIIKPVQRL